VGLIIFMLIYKIPSFTHWRTCVHIIFAHLDKRRKEMLRVLLTVMCLLKLSLNLKLLLLTFNLFVILKVISQLR
jgi:hypothetical protein